jgi:hypothetical protein
MSWFSPKDEAWRTFGFHTPCVFGHRLIDTQFMSSCRRHSSVDVMALDDYLYIVLISMNKNVPIKGH